MGARKLTEPRTVIGATALSVRLHDQAVHDIRNAKGRGKPLQPWAREVLDLTRDLAADLIAQRLGSPPAPGPSS